MQYTFKWFKAYEDKYDITKESLEKGFKVYDPEDKDFALYIYIDNGMLRFASTGIWDKGYEQPYNDEFGPLENMYDIMNYWWGRKSNNNVRIRNIIDSGNYEIGVKPEDDGLSFDFLEIS